MYPSKEVLMYPGRDPQFVTLINHLMASPEAYALVVPCDDETWMAVGEPHCTKSLAEILELLDGSDRLWWVQVEGSHAGDVPGFMMFPDDDEADFEFGYRLDYEVGGLGDDPISRFYEQYSA